MSERVSRQVCDSDPQHTFRSVLDSRKCGNLCADVAARHLSMKSKPSPRSCRLQLDTEKLTVPAPQSPGPHRCQVGTHVSRDYGIRSQWIQQICVSQETIRTIEGE